MAGNTTAIDELVLPEAIAQVVNLKTEAKSLRDEMVLLLETSIRLSGSLGGSTPATFAKNLKASTDATDKLIANSNKQIEVINRRMQAEESAANKYLVLLSKQQAERDKADAKEIAQAEKKAAKLQAIQERQAKTQFPTGSGPTPYVAQEPDSPMPRYEPIITGNENMGAAAKQATPAIVEETAALTEQEAVLQSVAGTYRENIALLISLQTERAANAAELKKLDTETAIGAERQIFLTGEQVRLKTAISQTNSTLNQQTKQMLATDTSAAQLNAQLNQLRSAYDLLTKEELENVEVGGVMLAEITRLDVAVKEHALSTGNTSKEVGAYEKAIAKATNASQLAATGVQVLTRSIIRMGVQFLLIGVVFAAISWLYDWVKGLDMFTGRLDQAVQNLKALNEVQKDAAAKAGESVGKFRILSDTVKDLSISYKDRLAAAEELKKLWPKELEHSSAQAIANGTEKDSLDSLTDSVVKLAKAKAAATAIEKTEGEIISLQIQRDKENAAKADVINTDRIKSKKNFAESVQYEARIQGKAALTQRQITELYNYYLTKQTNDVEVNAKKRADIANKDIADQIAVKEKTIKFLEQYGGLKNEAEAIEHKPGKAKKPKDTANTELLEYYRLQLEEVQKTNKLVFDNDQNTFEVRRVALGVYIRASEELVKNAQQVALSDTNISEQKRKNIVLKFHNDLLDVQRQYATETEKIQRQVSEKLKKELSDLVADNKNLADIAIQGLSAAKDGQLQIIQDQADKELAAVADKYTKRKISEKKYQEEITKIQDQANVDRLGQEAFYAQSVLEIREAEEAAEIAFAKVHGATGGQLDKIRAGSGVSEAQTAADKAGRALQSGLNKQTQDNAKGGSKDKNEVVKSAYDFAVGAQEAIRDLVDRNAENQIAKLQLVAKQVEDNANAEKAAVERGMDTQSNKARRIAEIDAQTASQKASLQAKENAEKNKEAKADKAAAIAKIVEGIAVGIIENGIITPTAALAAALGAVQLGVALGVQLPVYGKGTKNHPGGLAIIGDMGIERIEEPGRMPYYSPGVATMADLPQGTKVTPNNMLPQTPQWFSTSTDNSDVVNGLNRVEKAVKSSQPKPARNSGWLREQRQAEAWNSYANNHFR